MFVIISTSSLFNHEDMTDNWKLHTGDIGRGREEGDTSSVVSRSLAITKAFTRKGRSTNALYHSLELK